MDDETSGRARGGNIPGDVAATADRPSNVLTGCVGYGRVSTDQGAGRCSESESGEHCDHWHEGDVCHLCGDGAPAGRYHPGGVLPSGMAMFRNDTGRPLGPDEWHLLTYVGPIPVGVDAQQFIEWVSFKPGEKFYTADEVRKIGEKVVGKLLDEIAGRDVTGEGRAVPTSPDDVPVTIGFDGTASCDQTVMCVRRPDGTVGQI